MYDEIHRQMMAMQDNPDPGLVNEPKGFIFKDLCS